MNDNYGSSIEILIDGSPDYGTVIKWDISAIPSGEIIQSASITFTVFSSTGDVYEVYEMKRDWVESQATWNEYASGSSWETGGAQGSLDRGTTVLGTITGSTGSQTINLNSSGIALVQSWVDNPSSNFGITIQDYAGASDGMDFYSSEYATASWRPTFTVQYGSSGVVESRVSTGNDDAEERVSNGNMSLNSSDLELIRDGSRDQEVGMRFNNITLLQGVTIANAYIQFTVDERRSETTNLTFYGEDHDNAPTFSNSSGNISNRTKTSASVNWNNVPAWNSVGAAGSDQRTPDLSSIIQEIVDRPGWSSSNSIVIIVDGSGRRTAESYNGSSGSAPLLHIQYGSGSAGQTYYVRTDGNDSNSGTSNLSSGAWQTIQKAASTMTAGDSVRVQPGTYFENVTPSNSGTTGNSIVYKADGAVVMDGQNSSGYAFYMDGKDYIVIDGFTITNWPDGGRSHATVKFRNSDHGVVRNCVIHNTGRDAIYFHGSSNNCLVENNLFYNIDDDGISPRGNGDHIIRNNTFYSCGGWAVEHTNTNGNVYENNIFWEYLDNTTGGNVTFSYNDYIGGVLTGTGNISSDPLFVNSSGNDFHLSHTAAGQSSDSPCIDAGSATAASLGLDTRTTRTDQVVDAGTVDLGFHYLSGVVSFSDWTSAAGLSGVSNEYGISWGDYNNDGYTDLYITKRNALFINNGDGTFSTEPPYLYSGNRAGHWADYDNDGDLDFASTYNMYFSKNNGDGTFTHQSNSSMGFTQINNLGDVGWLDYNEDGYLDMWAPNGSSPYTYMYSNDGDGTFTGIAGSTIGLTANTNGETTVVTDYDGDGHTDILYRASSLFLWHSDGDGTFTDVTSSAGVSLTGTSGGYNGTAFGDYDNDGDLDFYGGQTGSNKLYRNNNDGTFTDVTSTAGVAGFSMTTKGVAWGDYDNDGDLELYVANENGSNQLFQNNGDGTFTDVAPGLGLNDNSQSFGVGWADFDLDGDLDLFVGNKSQASKLFQNQLIDTDYLKVKVRGSGAGGAPLDGTGSRVELWNSAGTALLAVREISGGEGMGSHSPRIVHFGLADSWGGSSGTYMVKVKFTGGNLVIAQNVTPDQRSITIGSTTLNHTIEVFEGSLLADIHFDECSWDGTSNEVADSSGNANHGTSFGGATTSSGKVCNTGVFNGSTGYVLVSTSPPIGDFSYSVWVKPSSASSSGWHQVISSWYTSLKDAFRMSISNNKVTIGVEDGSGYYASSNVGSIQDGNWYHIVGVKEGNDFKLYLNGSFINSVGSVPNPFNGSPTDFALGRNPHYSGGEYFAGSIDELLIYDKALSSAEINTIYTNQLAGLNADGTSRTCNECVTPTPLAWWQMDEIQWTGASGEVADSSGNGNHATAFGGIDIGEGKIGFGGVFDGVDDFIGTSQSLLSGLSEFAIAGWIKPQTGGTKIGFWGQNDVIELGFISGTTISFWTLNGGSINVSYPYSLAEWHHITVVGDGNNLKVYFDGTLATSGGSPTSDYGSSSDAFNIGGGGVFDPSGNYYTGGIDEVYIFNQSMNDDQVEYLYNLTHPCLSCLRDPVASWYLDEPVWTGAADEVIDSSGNNHHGMVYGAVQTTNGKIWRAGVFDGVDDYIEVADDPALDLVDNFTLAMWIKPTTVSPEWQGVFTKGFHGGSPGSPRAYSIYLNYDEVYISWYNSGWQHFTTTAANLQTGTWYHVVYVRSSTTETIYV
ncbi:MAG: VCBS repeat-containing protein, partial [Candidatus Marinimicrobia bacterium]|nr:VCBS repeat-containing protein [Candidatus Neomarinimicrobiota bacterium]